MEKKIEEILSDRKQHAIAFAEWISKNGWEPNGTDTWETWQEEYPDQYDTEFVYDLFLESVNK